MIIKADKWYKRVFLKLMWKLLIWQPPKYGKGVYKEQGIQVKEFDSDAICPSWKPISKTCRIDKEPCVGTPPYFCNKETEVSETTTRVSDAMRGGDVKKESGYVIMARMEWDKSIRELIRVKGNELYESLKSIYGDK